MGTDDSNKYCSDYSGRRRTEQVEAEMLNAPRATTADWRSSYTVWMVNLLSPCGHKLGPDKSPEHAALRVKLRVLGLSFATDIGPCSKNSN